MIFTKKSQQAWVEKYRPKKIAEISHQHETITSINNVIVTKNIPHFLFYGPSGTGKTSTILATILQLHNSGLIDSVLELNASSERGINVVRTKIKNFAQRSISKDKLKFIILDEADTMTIDAQTALRRCMEQYSSHTRFCIICNYISSIIDPIISRCAIYRFKEIPIDKVKSKLLDISEKENCKLSSRILEEIIKNSNGDMRKAINLLEMSSYFNDTSFIISEIPSNIIDKIITIGLTQSHIKLNNLVSEIISYGYDARKVLQLYMNTLITCPISETMISKIVSEIAISENLLVRGNDEYIELCRCFQLLFKLSSNDRKILKKFKK